MIMDAQTRKDLTAQGYIRRMFAETENGIFKVGYESRIIKKKDQFM